MGGADLVFRCASSQWSQPTTAVFFFVSVPARQIRGGVACSWQQWWGVTRSAQRSSAGWEQLAGGKGPHRGGGECGGLAGPMATSALLPGAVATVIVRAAEWRPTRTNARRGTRAGSCHCRPRPPVAAALAQRARKPASFSRCSPVARPRPRHRSQSCSAASPRRAPTWRGHAGSGPHPPTGPSPSVLLLRPPALPRCLICRQRVHPHPHRGRRLSPPLPSCAVAARR